MSCLYAHGFARSRSRVTGRATLPRARARADAHTPVRCRRSGAEGMYTSSYARLLNPVV